MGCMRWGGEEGEREEEREREREIEKHHPGGMTILQSLLLHSPFGMLAMHAHAPHMFFKPPKPGFELHA